VFRTAKRHARQLAGISRGQAMAEKRERSDMSDRLSALEKELTRLRRQNADMTQALADATQRVQDLESARDLALDRIEWAIDSLHTVIEQEQ
jgi:TolA-binding protein